MFYTFMYILILFSYIYCYMFRYGCIFIQHVCEVILSQLRGKTIIRSEGLCGNLKG
jgi:hypothetical protein